MGYIGIYFSIFLLNSQDVMPSLEICKLFEIGIFYLYHN